jgi:ABC-type branched-subunit amino acid transport system ATPase component
MLAVTGLSKQYGDTLAVDGVSFLVGCHEILGLLGPNGAGKTTTLNMVLGVLSPSACQIAPAEIPISSCMSCMAPTSFLQLAEGNARQRGGQDMHAPVPPSFRTQGVSQFHVL